ncbi:MAG TPA: glycogen/starch synthase [Gammaproteobacteria bacterium]|nr:glycogen/starch synthase [Gammaproteobacteria bacterium]
MGTDIENPICVLHVALEFGPATFGGLGRVATQMVDAQNRFEISDKRQFDASIITPFYPYLYANYANNAQAVATIEHLYDNKIVTSKIFCVEIGETRHYLVQPPPEYQHLFAMEYLPEIYTDTQISPFIQRVKFFNSCVAAYVNNPNIGSNHPAPQILQLHDWQSALVPKLLKELHLNTSIKSVFTVHIDNGDRGTYNCSELDGIGLNFHKSTCIMKALGLINSDKIVAVSPRFLRECIETKFDDPELEFLRKIFAWSSVQNKTMGIANGINYADYCPLGKQINDAANVHFEKARIKQQIAAELQGSRLLWKFDPNLPLILYVGRYSPEKGPETFEQVIRDTAGRATFVAVGRGMTDEVFRVMVQHSRQTDNVFITASETEQAQLIQLLRAGADIVFIPSHRDAFGLVGPEGLANGSIIVTTGVGGLRDVVQGLNYSDTDDIIGNGIFYEDMPEAEHNPALTQALNQALDLFATLTDDQLNAMQTKIMLDAQKFDWAAENGSLHQYLQIYKSLIHVPEDNTPRPLRLPKPSPFGKRRKTTKTK